MRRELKDEVRARILGDVERILNEVQTYPLKGKDFKSLMLFIAKDVTAVIPLRQLIAGGIVFIKAKQEYTREAVFSHVSNVVINAIEKL